MTMFESRRRVLFVDDDKAFLETMQRLMGALSHGSWEIFTAENTAQAFVVLQDHSPHLIVIDVQMPVMDGLQFLTLLNRRHPNLPKVILTAYAAREDYRAACLSKGAELFLEKPKSSAGHESLFATLHELIKWQPEEGFRGVLRRVGLQDVLQMECLSRNSSVLEVKTRRSQGRIFIQEGRIVHAVLGESKGERAFNRMLAFRRGEFALKPFSEPPEHTLEGSWEFLLMEAARMRDEMGDTLDDDAPDAADAGRRAVDETTRIGRVARGEVAATAAPAPRGHGLPDAVRENAVPRDATTARARDDVPATSPASRPAADGPAPRRVIEEVLVCSAQGEVLHDWQCRNSDLWINFFEFLSQKSRRLAQGLVLGDFNRLEVTGSGERLVALVSPKRGVLVRSRLEARAAASPASS